MSHHLVTGQTFDHVLVVDRLALTGMALSGLAGQVFRHARCEHVTTYADMDRYLVRYTGKRMLIIMELFTEVDSMSSGLARLNRLGMLAPLRHCQVMVCTDLISPQLLRLVTEHRPAALALRTDPLAALQVCMLKANARSHAPVLSPRVQAAMQPFRTTKFTARELQWLISQIEGMGLEKSARMMGIKYSTSVGYGMRVAEHLGLSGRRAFIQWINDNVLEASAKCSPSRPQSLVTPE